MQEKTPPGDEGMLPSAPCADAQRVPPPLLFITNQSLPFSPKSESTELSSKIVVLLKPAVP